VRGTGDSKEGTGKPCNSKLCNGSSEVGPGNSDRGTEVSKDGKLEGTDNAPSGTPPEIGGEILGVSDGDSDGVAGRSRGVRGVVGRSEGTGNSNV
jgi:hypothetical protein